MPKSKNKPENAKLTQQQLMARIREAEKKGLLLCMTDCEVVKS
jgi:hypothetical protein